MDIEGSHTCHHKKIGDQAFKKSSLFAAEDALCGAHQQVAFMNHPASDTETLLQLYIVIYVSYAVHSISANVTASHARAHLSDAHLESLAAGWHRPGISGVGGPRTVTLTGEPRGPSNGLMYAVVLNFVLCSPVQRQY